jgi:hypothetical protein
MRTAVLVASMAVALALSASAASAAEVAVIRSLDTVRPGQTPSGLPVDDPAAGPPTAHLEAARNEFESFQIAVENDGGAPLTGLDVSTMGALAGPEGATIPASDITIYREAYYTVYTPSDQEEWQQYEVPSDGEGFDTSWKCTEATVGPTYPLPCEFPDALIPKRDSFYGETRNAFPTTVPSGQNRVAWIDVLVPQGSPTGEYSGHLEVTADGLDQAVDLKVKVFNFEVPSTPTLQGGWDMTPNRPCSVRGGCASAEEGFALNSLYDRAALENRVSITHPAYADPTGDPADPGSNAALFRRFVLPLMDGTSPAGPGGEWSPIRLAGARLGEVFINQYSAAAAGAWKSEANAGGFFGKVRFYCDEMGENLSRWTNECNGPWETATAAWGGGLKTAFTGNLAALKFAQDHGLPVAGSIDTLIPLVDQMHPRNGTNQRDAYDAFAGQPGDRLWLYQTCDSVGCSGGYTSPNDYSSASLWNGWPSLAIDQPPAEVRAMDWQVFDYKAAGQFYYEVARQLPVAWNNCHSTPTNCLYIDGGNGDGTLFYPGTPAEIGGTHEVPVESIRLKHYRDGEEDYELLHHLADDLGDETAVREIAGGPYDTDPGSGLFSRMNASDVTGTALEAARERLIALLPLDEEALHEPPEQTPETPAEVHEPAPESHEPAPEARQSKPGPTTPTPVGGATGGGAVGGAGGGGESALRRPDTRLEHAPRSAIATNGRTAEVKLRFVSPQGASGFRCSLDGRVLRHCLSPLTLTVRVGRHTFTVAAVGPAGTDPSPAADRFTVSAKQSKKSG